VELALDVEAQGRQVMVHGHFTFEWEGACRRCLEPTRQVETAEVQEVFEPSPVEGETWLLDGDHIDLAPVVRQAASLALPLAPLCRPDCPGPDPEHYPATGAGPGAGDTAGAGREGNQSGDPAGPARDPRWAALDELRFDQD
jgi:uncharacterized protein